MLHQKLFLLPALALALSATGCGGGDDARDDDLDVPPVEAGFDQVDQVPIDPAADTDADGMVDSEEGLSVEPPDTGRAAVNEVPVPPPPQ